MTLAALIARYGLFAVFLGAGIEGETVVMLGGFLARQHLLPWPGVVVVACLGSFLADQGFFLLGRRFREHRLVRRITATPAFAYALTRIDRHPVGFIFAFRFLYGLRTVSPVAIGMTSVSARRFVPLNAVAALLWAGAITAVGYIFGQGAEMLFGRLRHRIEHVLMIVVPLAVLVALVFLWLRRRQIKRWDGLPR